MNQNLVSATDIRRFGYYIPKLDGTMDFRVYGKVADNNVLTEFHEIIGVVFNLQPIIFAFDVVDRNYRELLESIETIGSN